MAVNLRQNTEPASHGYGRFERILRRVILRTRDEPLVPRGFIQLQLTPGTYTNLDTPLRSNNRTWPPGVRTMVVNVEGASLRYCDSDTARPGYGELYQAGTAFVRTIRVPQQVTFATDAANASTTTINVSLYGEPDD